MLDWREYIHSDPEVLLGKPIIKGTRLAVEFILELLANGWTEQQILENYPKLEMIHLQCIFAFMVETIHDEALFLLPKEGNKGQKEITA